MSQLQYQIRCKQCDFLMGFSETEITGGTCIYCTSEREYFLAYFGNGETGEVYIYETISTDKTSYRRGLMHDRKRAVKEWFEFGEEVTDEDLLKGEFEK